MGAGLITGKGEQDGLIDLLGRLVQEKYSYSLFFQLLVEQGALKKGDGLYLPSFKVPLCNSPDMYQIGGSGFCQSNRTSIIQQDSLPAHHGEKIMSFGQTAVHIIDIVYQHGNGGMNTAAILYEVL